jgi:exo-beta-1,3-glucanase (GH17 family)
MNKIAPKSAFVSFLVLNALPGLASAPAAIAAAIAAPRDTNIVFKDPRPFKCVCYSGYRDGQGPGQAEPSEAQVREDLILLKKRTHEIRTYGSGKGTHGNFVPRLADELGLTVHLGIWVDATYDEAANLAAVDDAIALIREGHKSIKSVIVGNEYMLRVRHPEITPTPDIKPDKVLSEARLVNWIKRVKDAVPKDMGGMGAIGGIEVTTADTWSEILADGDELLSQLDFVTWHLHPWWEDQAIGNAAAYLAARHQALQDRIARFPGKRLVLGETGWPTLANHGGAVGSPENQARYFKELTAWGFNNRAEFWSFTAFDENWKNAEGTVGGHWGFWSASRQPQPIITGLNALFPKYMWSENPELATRVNAPPFRTNRSLRAARSGSVSPGPADALGRPMGTLTGNAAEGVNTAESGNAAEGQGRALMPSNGSRGLFIRVP